MPRVFISYSWDSEEHRAWVRKLATLLRRDGIESILDQWNLVPGDQLPSFMEEAIRNSDFVLIVCTPRYKSRSDSRAGGVGYEGDVITGEVLDQRNNRKFIPLLRSRDWSSAAPFWLRGKVYIDFSDDSSFTRAYQELLDTLLGNRLQPPPVGIPEQSATLRSQEMLTIRDPFHLEMVHIEGGESHLESWSTTTGEPVWISDFFISRSLINREQFDTYLAAVNARKLLFFSRRLSRGGNDWTPARIDWHEAVDFCRWLRQRGAGDLRLPTEAELEKAGPYLALPSIEFDLSEWCADGYRLIRTPLPPPLKDPVVIEPLKKVVSAHYNVYTYERVSRRLGPSHKSLCTSLYEKCAFRLVSSRQFLDWL